MGQADAENRPLLRNLRKRRPHSDRDRTDRLRAAASGPRRQQDRREPARLCKAYPNQPDAPPADRRTSQTPAEVGAKTAHIRLRTLGDPSGTTATRRARHPKYSRRNRKSGMISTIRAGQPWVKSGNDTDRIML